MPTNNEQENQQLSFDAIKIGLASPETILEWSKGEVTKPETINLRKTVFSASVFSDLARTGNATAVNTKRSVIKVLSAIDAALRSQRPPSVVSVWVTLPWQLRFLISGISKEFLAVWD